MSEEKQNILSTEPVTPSEAQVDLVAKAETLPPKDYKVRKFLGKVGLAAACAIPVADLALSDAIAAKEYEIVHKVVEQDSNASERATEQSLLLALGVAETVALGQAITKTKKLRGAFEDFDDYREEKHKTMSKPRRAVSKAVNVPFAALEAIGKGFTKVGERVAESDSKLFRKIGKIAVETGQVNALGTSTVIMQETMADKPPTLKRQAYLGGLITGSWLVMAEGVRQAYQNIPAIRPPLNAIGRTFETLTSIDFTNPLSTPVSTIAISSTVAALAYTGWKIEEFRQSREELLTVDPSDIVNAPAQH